MLKICGSFIVFIFLFSCKPSTNESVAELNKKPKIKKDSTVVGADKDENGCLASAGYTWSKVNKECVQIFSGIGLQPIDKDKNTDAIFYAYVFFSENGTMAEVFLPGNENSMILSRKQKPNPWVLNNYKLIAKDGYVLEKDGKPIYFGDGEAGSKITGTDVPED